MRCDKCSKEIPMPSPTMFVGTPITVSDGVIYTKYISREEALKLWPNNVQQNELEEKHMKRDVYELIDEVKMNHELLKLKVGRIENNINTLNRFCDIQEAKTEKDFFPYDEMVETSVGDLKNSLECKGIYVNKRAISGMKLARNDIENFYSIFGPKYKLFHYFVKSDRVENSMFDKVKGGEFLYQREETIPFHQIYQEMLHLFSDMGQSGLRILAIAPNMIGSGWVIRFEKVAR